MLRFLIFLLLALSWLQSGAQSPQVDSLRQLLQTSSGTKRVDVLNAYAYIISSYDFAVAQKSIDEAYALSIKLNYTHGMAEAMLYNGIIESNIGHDSVAMIAFRKSLAYSESSNEKQVRGRTLTSVGLAFQNADQIDSAQYFYEEAYRLLKDSVSPLNLSFLFNQMSSLYGIQNKQALQYKYLKKSWEIRKNLGDRHALVWTGVAIANYYTQSGNFKEALSYLTISQKALQADTTDSEEIAIIYKQRGIIYANLGNHLGALDQFAKAKKYYERNPYVWDLNTLLIEIGNVQSEVANFELALIYYFQALKQAEANRFHQHISLLYFRIGWVYYLMEQNSLAEEYAQKALRSALPRQRKFEEASAYNLLGLLAMRDNRNESSLDYFKRALKLRKESNNPVRVSSTLLNIGLLYERTNYYKQAENYELQSLAIAEKMDHSYGICEAYLSLGRLYHRMKLYEKSDVYLSKAEGLAKKTGLREILSEIYKSKRGLWFDQSDYQKAFSYSMKYEALKDSLLNKNMSNRILSLRHDFELDQKENEIKILNQQKQLQQNTLELQKSEITKQRTVIVVGVIISVAIGAIAIIIFGYYKKVKRLNKEIHERSEEINAQAEELREANEALGNLNREISEQKEEIQAQAEELTESNQTIARINESLEDKIKLRTSELKEAYHELDTFLYRSSHDFRRPLTTFMGLAEVAKVSVKEVAALELFEKVKETANNLDKMLGKLQSVNLVSTAGIVQSEVDFKDLFESETHFFQYELLKKKIIVTTQVDIVKPISSYPILIKVVIQNLLENAVAFCSEEKPTIHLSACSADGEVRLQVSDNGQGIDAAYLPRIYEMYFRANEKSIGNGLGLYIVKKMVDKLEGRIEMESELGKGTTVKIFLPMSIN